MSFEFNPDAKIKKISRSWERLKEWREDNIELEDLDKILNPILDGGRAAICDFIKNNPLPIIENPVNTGLERFWSDVARCDLDDEERPKPRNDAGLDKFCLPFEGGKGSGVEYSSITVFARWTTIDPETGNQSIDSGEVSITGGTLQLRTPIESVCIIANSGSPHELIAEVTTNSFTGTTTEGRAFFSVFGGQVEVSVFQRLPESERIDDPDEVIIVNEARVVSINWSDEPDEEGEEEGDDPPPPWVEDDDPPEPDTDIEIDIPAPPNYPVDFPDPPPINIRFDSDNRRIEGDKFVINPTQEGIDLVFDAFDPPEFLDTALDVIGDAADIASDVLPAPFDTIPRLVSDILDDEEDEEEEEPIEIDIDRKSCEQGELKTTTETIEVLPSQERVVREIIESQNRIEEVRCSVGAFQAVRVEITEFPVRGKARFGDSPEQSKFFFGWIQFTREGEMFGVPKILEFNPQTFPFPLEADDFLIQFIDGAEGETEVIELEENGGE